MSTNIRAVTKEDVMRVAKEYLTEDNRTVGILVPVKEMQQKCPEIASRSAEYRQ